MRQQPIPPPSEPMQYRAIGLIRGRYTASTDQFTRGTLRTADGSEIQAVLLGRVMSLVKKHLDLAEDHLWVVYPRTQEKDKDLYVQIVGVWEPEKLHPESVATAQPGDQGPAAEETGAESVPPESPRQASESQSTGPDPGGELDAAVESEEFPSAPVPEVRDDYFSIRGEVIFQSHEQDSLIVKIRQSSRKSSDQGSKSFKLRLQGTLPAKAIGQFWDLHAQRQDSELQVLEGHFIGVVPPQKRAARRTPGTAEKRSPGKRSFPRKRQGSTLPTSTSDRPASGSQRPQPPRPVKRTKIRKDSQS